MENNPIYDRNTIEFVTVAVEFCTLMETPSTLTAFVDKAVKILPLLYVKATLLPDIEADDDFFPENYITEETYEALRRRTAGMMGEHDAYLDTFHGDMSYSDTPVVSTISESLTDVYQDIGNFAASFREGSEQVMAQTLALCKENFRLHWGQNLLNALKALHALQYGGELTGNKDGL